jgi:hypothetical protein
LKVDFRRVRDTPTDICQTACDNKQLEVPRLCREHIMQGSFVALVVLRQ